MAGIFFTNILHAKVIHDYREINWAGYMFPEAGGMTHFVISTWTDFFSQVFLCLFSCLGEAVNGPPDFEIDISIFGMGLNIVLLLDMHGEIYYFH